MFKNRNREEDLFDLLGEEAYKKHRLQEDMKIHEQQFKDFLQLLPTVKKKIDSFRFDPDNKPHGLADELLTDMEIIHWILTDSLYRLRVGELKERLNSKEIDLLEYNKLTEELYKKEHPYIYI